MKRILLFFCLFPLLCWGQRIPRNAAGADPALQLQKFNQFYRYLNGAYVDTINNAKLIEEAIEKILSELDPHSAYISAEDMVPVEESFQGSFSGIGIEFNVLNDTLLVVNTIAGGPSEKVGLLPNDRIVAVDGESVVGIKQARVPKVLRGPKGSVVEIEVLRKGEPEPLHFRITRDDIPINTVDAAYKIDDKTGYIKVNRFAATTMKEVEEAYGQMGKIDALILDLRGNGGGFLDQAVKLGNFFLPEGATIVSTEGRLVPPERFTARTDGVYLKGKVIVLIDESSASASEIVAGAIQDWDRGLIIGRRSFGKGLVQRQFPLIDGSAVRITVARYHTPTGRVIQRPFEKGNQEAYYEAFAKRFEHGADSLKAVDSLRFTTLRSGRPVYGGGGIYPDIYVPLDTTNYSAYWAKLVRRGVISEYVIQYLDKHRSELQRTYPTFEKFQTSFAVTPDMIQQLVALGEKREVASDPEGLKTSGGAIALQIKALIAQKLWDMNEYFRIINSENDPELERALEVLENWNKTPETDGIGAI